MTENDLQLGIWIKMKMKIKEGYRLQVGRSGKRKAKSGKRKGEKTDFGFRIADLRLGNHKPISNYYTNTYGEK